mmetsp:Transcript_21320/g.54064  ORF Transcript_21320/g.54064 Transcript_21320/m.54064 type:complete len:170 (-) Transcript_21320:246-755(-)
MSQVASRAATPAGRRMAWIHSPDPILVAARGGRLEVLQRARAKGNKWDTLTCDAAARGGHLAVLKLARAEGCPLDDSVCLNTALRGAHLGVLQWLRNNGCVWDKQRFSLEDMRDLMESVDNEFAFVDMARFLDVDFPSGSKVELGSKEAVEAVMVWLKEVEAVPAEPVY